MDLLSGGLSDPWDDDYGRMFPDLPPYEPPGHNDTEKRDALFSMGRELLVENDGPDASSRRLDHPQLAAGYTYFGQFVAHDVSFLSRRPGARGSRLSDQRNLRTAGLDLDSIYGAGPTGDTFYYRRRRLAELSHRAAETSPALVDNDLPRAGSGLAIIPDLRNDENVMVSQIHLALLMAHNKIARVQSGSALDLPVREAHAIWAEARRVLQWHFQWVVFNDYLPRILDAERRRWLQRALQRYSDWALLGPGVTPAVTSLPAEFVLGAFRFGHSLVRPGYALNAVVRRPRPLTPRVWGEPPGSHLTGFHPLVADWTIDWRFFFDVELDGAPELPAALARRLPQRARRFDTHVTGQLGNLPAAVGGGVLPALTLTRGWRLGLPGGRAVAEALRQRDERITLCGERDCPLWIYVLREAEEYEGGRCLGPVGSTIVARTFFCLLAGMPDSYLNVKPDWRPTLPKRGPEFTVADLLLYAWPEPRMAPQRQRSGRRERRRERRR